MENELKKDLTKTKIDRLIEENNLPVKLLHLLKENMALIVNFDKKTQVIREGQWTRDMEDKTTFSFGEYFFEVIYNFHQNWDSRDNDGVTAGWRTAQEKSILIIKNKNGGKVLETDILKYHYYFDLILYHATHEKGKELPKIIKNAQFYIIMTPRKMQKCDGERGYEEKIEIKTLYKEVYK